MTDFLKNQLDTIAKGVANQISKWYHGATVYAYCDFYHFDTTQDPPTFIPVTWICEGTDDFDDPKFAAGFEQFCKKAGLDWRIIEWADSLGRSLSETGYVVYMTTIHVRLNTSIMDKNEPTFASHEDT